MSFFLMLAAVLFVGEKYGRTALAYGLVNGTGFGLEVEKTFEMQLHVGVPGATGVENVAVEKAKKSFTLKKPIGGPYLTNGVAAIEWAEVVKTETYTYFSLWKEGNFIGYGKISNSKGEEVGVPVEVGDTFKINKEALEVSFE